MGRKNYVNMELFMLLPGSRKFSMNCKFCEYLVHKCTNIRSMKEFQKKFRLPYHYLLSDSLWSNRGFQPFRDSFSGQAYSTWAWKPVAHFSGMHGLLIDKTFYLLFSLCCVILSECGPKYETAIRIDYALTATYACTYVHDSSLNVCNI